MAINPSALQAIKLKSTAKDTLKHTTDPLKLYASGVESKQKEEERWKYFFSTGLGKWYEDLKDVTIPSTLLELTPDEARAIIECWKEYYCHKSSHDTILLESQFTIPPSLLDLVERISKLIESFSAKKCVFVKLSTRSPKDSLISFNRAKETFQSWLNKQPSVSGNDKLIEFGQVVIDSLQVHNGLEAIKLLVSSDRVGEDLEYALDPGDEGFNDRMNIVVREWVDVPLSSEFRGFVWGRKLTSIGQYSHPVVFQDLLGKTQKIKSDLQDFFDRIKGKIPLDHYMIDFAWTEDDVYLIEINPFDGEIVFPASTGLWDWDKDREQMMKGDLELRIRTEEQSDFDLKKKLDPQWRNIIFP